VARVVTPHGLLGEVSCSILTDFPDRFASTAELLVGDPPVAHAVENQRLHQDRLLLKLAGVDDRAAAERLRGALLQVPVEAAVALPAGSYYWYQLIGLQVIDDLDRELGELVEVLPTGSNDVYVVRGQFGEILLPAIKDVVREVDLATGLVHVHLLPGLLDGA
jgi:16S rRNA processing protein RimM